MTIPGNIGSKLNQMLGVLSAGLMSKRGQTLVEYALLLILIAVVVILMIKGLGGTVNNTYSKINTALPT